MVIVPVTVTPNPDPNPTGDAAAADTLSRVDALCDHIHERRQAMVVAVMDSISQRDRQIAELQELVARKDDQIGQLSQRVARVEGERDTVAADLRQVTCDKNVDHARLTDALQQLSAQREADVKRLSAELHQAEQRAHDILVQLRETTRLSEALQAELEQTNASLAEALKANALLTAERDNAVSAHGELQLATETMLRNFRGFRSAAEPEVAANLPAAPGTNSTIVEVGPAPRPVMASTQPAIVPPVEPSDAFEPMPNFSLQRGGRAGEMTSEQHLAASLRTLTQRVGAQPMTATGA